MEKHEDEGRRQVLHEKIDLWQKEIREKDLAARKVQITFNFRSISLDSAREEEHIFKLQQQAKGIGGLQQAKGIGGLLGSI